MTRSKNQIAQSEYDCDFEDLNPGEKAAVTRKFNAQPARATNAPRRAATAGALSVQIGRIGVNGTKTCLMTEGSTVGDLITQANYTLDSKKEGVTAQSTGNAVSLTDEVVHGEIYVIAPEIKSA